MSDQAHANPLWEKKTSEVVEMNINITDGYDLGTVGIHPSRFSIPPQSVFQPYATGSVKEDPLVGTGASVAIGTDSVTTDPDNILDTTAITGLDAAHDCLTPAFGTAIVNNTDSAVPIHYNITDAPLTSGKLRAAGLMTAL